LEECTANIYKQRDVYKRPTEEESDSKVMFHCKQCGKILKSNFSLRQHEKKCPITAPSEGGGSTPQKRPASDAVTPTEANGTDRQQPPSRQQNNLLRKSLDYCLKVSETCFVPGCSSKEKPTSGHLFTHDNMDRILEIEFPSNSSETFECPCPIEFDDHSEFILHLKREHWANTPPPFLKEYTLRNITSPAEQKAIEAAAAASSRESSVPKTKAEACERRTPSPLPSTSANNPAGIICSKCKASFPTKSAKTLHTCNSIIDQKGIADDTDVRKSKPQLGALAESPIKKIKWRNPSGPKRPKTSNVDKDSDSEPRALTPAIQGNAPTTNEEVSGNKKRKLVDSSDSENSGNEETGAAKRRERENSSSDEEGADDTPSLTEAKECEHCRERFATLKAFARHNDEKHPEYQPW
jgi:hypothetical protein